MNNLRNDSLEGPMRTHREASFYETLAGDRARCTLCPHDCRIVDGGRGACGMRVNRRGKLYTLAYHKAVARNLEPIEKKPFFHFLPGSTAYSIATVGCCLRCAFCQNWQLSQWPKDHLPRKLEWRARSEGQGAGVELAALEKTTPGAAVTPRRIVGSALAAGAESIAYTFTEPTVFFELAYDTAILARSRGLRNLFVTSGFTREAPLRQIAAVLDAVNVDLKYFREESYRRISRARLAPILEACRLYRELGVWLEVTTLIIPRINDSAEELSQIAGFIRSLGPEVPWHVSPFYPAYEMARHPSTPLETLRRARRIGRDAGLCYVYAGLVPGGEDTHCSSCGALLIERDGHSVRSNRIREARCPDCGAPVDGVQMSAPGPDTGDRSAARNRVRAKEVAWTS
jgi:pyruvate formate lyase activating enzyme